MSGLALYAHPFSSYCQKVLIALYDGDAGTVTMQRDLLDRSYDWLEQALGDGWTAGAEFGLAECAAGPSLFYADWVHPIGGDRPKLAAYRARPLERPSFARAVDEARPYRPLFPGGPPDRDWRGHVTL